MSQEFAERYIPELTQGEVATYLVIALGKSVKAMTTLEMVMALPPVVNRSFRHYAFGQPVYGIRGHEQRYDFFERMLIGSAPLIETDELDGRRLRLTVAGENHCEAIWEAHERDANNYPHLPDMLPSQ